jgi:predicted NBD/HSP70 family sugar kinase
VGYLPLAGIDVRDADSRRRGPLDAAASGAGVVTAARREGMTAPTLTAEQVFTAARAGERGASRAVAHQADRIALAVAAVSAVLDPELVILGGGVGANGDLLMEPVQRRVTEISPFRPRIEATTLREEATLYGSVFMALQAAQELLFDRSAAS